MSVTILVPLVVLPVLMLLAYTWYRRKMQELAPDTDGRDSSGMRLTSERLREVPTPPTRVVYEIRDRLGDVDHVVIAPSGVIAIETILADRPIETATDDPARVAAAAVARGDVDELARGGGASCELLAKVFWGTPQPDQPAARDVVHGTVAVEGQRLLEWLESLPDDVLDGGRIDLAWRAIVTGIGRPDPLT